MYMQTHLSRKLFPAKFAEKIFARKKFAGNVGWGQKGL
jgi:hypothetical protein